jgi:hypothetical protein
MVQGVVVQITSLSFIWTNLLDSKQLNDTYILEDLTSLYSISASANAVWLDQDQ